MISLFSALYSGLIRPSSVNIDNNVCKLHYRATVALLMAFSILVTSRQYIGDPIECMGTNNVPSNLLDQYCWISSTFTLPKAFDRRIGVEVPHHGIDKSIPGDQRIYHQYYQWVCFVLFLQGTMFYIPHYIWKIWEGGRLKALAGDLKSPILDEDYRKKKQDILTNYFVSNFHSHNMYFAQFMLCEMLNLANVIGQIYFTDRFLGGEFTTYGAKVIRFTETNQENRTDPMIRVFPRVTKCIFHYFGSSGDVQLVDTLCVLPINIINEKIYVFLWFWFILIAVITGIAVGYRLFLLGFPHVRFFLLRMHVRMMKTSEIERIIHKSQVGDWFLLYQMSKNMNFTVFVEFLTALGQKLEEEDKQKHHPIKESNQFNKESNHLI